MKIRVVAIVAGLLTVSAALAGTSLEFRFDRLWPALQQPWYFNAPRGIAEDEFGNVFVADDINNKVRKFSRDGTLITQWGRQGFAEDELAGPKGLAIGPDGNVWVTDDEYVRVFDPDGNFLRRFGGFGNTCPGKFTVIADIDFDDQNSVFVTDSNNDRVQKFADLGQCLANFPAYDDQAEGMPCAIPDPDPSGCVTAWGGSGTGASEFDSPRGIGVNDAGEVFVVDHNNNRVQKFAGDGTFITEWGGEGSADGQFSFPDGLFIDAQDQVVVADYSNNRIQFFDGNGAHQQTIDGSVVQTADDFHFPVALSILESGEMYVTDLAEYRVLRFDAARNLTANWTSGSTLAGRFAEPAGIDIGPGPMGGDRLYVADTANHRIQVFQLDGQLDYTFGSFTGQGGDFDSPEGLAVGNGVVYVFNSFGRVDSFSLDGMGTLLDSWPDIGDGSPDPFLPNCAGQLANGRGIALDSQGNVYVSDYHEDPTGHRVLKFDSAGNCLMEIGNSGSGSEVLSDTAGIAIDARDWLFVAEPEGVRVVVFDDGGQFQFEFGSECTVPDPPCLPGDLDSPYGLAIDGDRVYVSDGIAAFDTALFPQRIHVFDRLTGNFIARFAPPGVGPGQVVEPRDLAVDGAGRVFVGDSLTNRVQRFVTTALPDDAKAIVVAGGGPFPGNVLWPATQSNASFAYRALGLQGFGRDTVQYLSADTDLDLDQNGLADDVDADARNENLREAILGTTLDGMSGFAADAEDLVLYLVDHGGQDTFRMAGNEVLSSATLGQWLDTWQQAHPGSTLTVIYDACQSGSFLTELASSQHQRVVITSSLANENAYFVSQGTLSFSNFFWTGIFNGRSLGDAFERAAQSTSDAFPAQNPQLDADGDGVYGGATEIDPLRTTFIGSGTDQFGQAPVIDDFTAVQGATDNQVVFTATGVSDSDGIARVWVVIRPPGFNPASPDNPVSGLPTADLQPTGNMDEFQVTYGGLSEPGTYQFILYALDALGNTALPRADQLSVGNPLSRRAVIVVGGDPADPAYAALATGADRAYRALDEQGYGPETCPTENVIGLCDTVTCDNVCYLTDAGGIGLDAAPSLASLQTAVTQWGVDPEPGGMAEVQDLTVYLAAQANGSGGYRLTADPGDDLDAATLAGWLDTVQALLPGTLTLVIEGDGAEDFLAGVAAATSATQILVGSTGSGETAVQLSGGEVSFSRFFWTQVLNGASVRNAFNLGSQAIRFAASSQVPQLDDDGDGAPNGLLDGLRASRYSIGQGILLAGDSPLVQAVTVSNPLLSEVEPITVFGVTTTGAIDRVVSVVTQPDGRLVEQVLPQTGEGEYGERSIGLCGPAGSYEVAAFAIDADGNASLPATATTERSTPCDLLFFSGFE